MWEVFSPSETYIVKKFVEITKRNYLLLLLRIVCDSIVSTISSDEDKSSLKFITFKCFSSLFFILEGLVLIHSKSQSIKTVQPNNIYTDCRWHPQNIDNFERISPIMPIDGVLFIIDLQSLIPPTGILWFLYFLL